MFRKLCSRDSREPGSQASGAFLHPRSRLLCLSLCGAGWRTRDNSWRCCISMRAALTRFEVVVDRARTLAAPTPQRDTSRTARVCAIRGQEDRDCGGRRFDHARRARSVSSLDASSDFWRKQRAPHYEFSMPIKLSRRGVEQKIVLASTSRAQPARDEVLIRGVARAHAWFDELRSGRSSGITVIAARERLPESYVQLMMPLAFLAPDIVIAILDGRQPADLTLSRLMKKTTLARDWAAQRRQLGLSP